MKKVKFFLIAIFCILFAVGGCKNKEEEKEKEYETSKTYYLKKEGKDYYTLKEKDSDNYAKYEVDEKYDFDTLLTTINSGEKIVIERDIVKSSTDNKTHIVNKSITIEGVGDNKPKIYGNIRIDLPSDELNPVVITNLEIIHSGKYDRDNENKIIKSQDERRGILIYNGGATIMNNYIHLADENPETKLTSASTGIQISVSSESTNQDKYSYNIKNNKIGQYKRSQTSSSADPVGILIDIDTNAHPNISEDQAKYIYSSNQFVGGTECYLAMFDYTITRYLIGYFISDEVAKIYVGNNYEYVVSGKTITCNDNLCSITEINNQ